MRLGLGSLVVGAWIIGCSAPPAVLPVDAGLDAATVDASTSCTGAAECDDHVFCNGAERCTADRCAAGDPPCAAAACDEATDACSCSTDADGDGARAAVCGGGDCDDTDPARHPGASEVCDAAGVDEDCDPTTFGARDADGDGFVSSACCNGASCGDDCDDARRGVSPGLLETCDLLDNDCDTAIDETLVVATYYADCDGDMFAAMGADALTSCGPPSFPPPTCGGAPSAGWTPTLGDCDDVRVARNPAVTEACNGIDDDCDGAIDDGLMGVTVYADCDGDMHGAIGGQTGMGCALGVPSSCAVPATAGWSPLHDDCNDALSSVHPGAADLCASGVDEDCDGALDEGAIALYPDTDGDGYGAGVSVGDGCTSSPGLAIVSGDCNDTLSTIHPGAPELCDGTLDEDCDSRIDELPASALSCGTVAGTTFGCVAGSCTVAACGGTRADCNHGVGDGCEVDTASSVLHCGSCGAPCPQGSTCAGGTCRPRWTWSRSFGAGDSDEIVDIVHDAAGNVFILGSLRSTAVGQAGSIGAPALVTTVNLSEGFLVSYDASGTYRWSRRLGSATSAAGGAAIAIDASGNLYLAGAFTASIDVGGGALVSAGAEDLLYASFTNGGAHRWSRRFGTTVRDTPWDLAVDPAGNVVATGTIYGTVDFGGGPRGVTATNTAFVLGLTSAGAYRWATSIVPTAAGSTNQLASGEIAVDALGNSYLAGGLRGGVDFGGMAFTATGTNADLILASYAPTGALRWARRYGGPSDDAATNVAVDGSDLYVLGAFYGTTDLGGGSITVRGTGASDLYVASYSLGDGTFRWLRSLGGVGLESALGLAVTSDAQVLVAGSFRGDVDLGAGTMSGDSAFLLGLGTAAGAYRFVRAFPGDAMGRAVDSDATTVWLGGDWYRTSDFGGGPLPAYDCSGCATGDGFVAAFAL